MFTKKNLNKKVKNNGNRINIKTNKSPNGSIKGSPGKEKNNYLVNLLSPNRPKLKVTDMKEL